MTSIFEQTEKCLLRTGPASWSLDKTHLLYLGDGHAHDYTVFKDTSDDYNDGFHAEIIEIMEARSASWLRSSGLELVDLGPGEFPDKTAPLIKAASRAGLPITYVAVDISPFFLKKVQKSLAVLAPAATFHAIESRFEDITADTLSGLGLKAPYVYIGPTYMNFDPIESARMMAQMLPSLDSFAMVASELLTPDNDPEKIRLTYDNEQLRRVAFGPLANLGCHRDHFNVTVDYNSRFQRIEANNHCLYEDERFKTGDCIRTLISYRASREKFESDLGLSFNRRLIFPSATGHTAVAFCGL